METSAGVEKSELCLKNHWRLNVDKSERWKLQSNPGMSWQGVLGEAHFCEFLPPEVWSSSHSEYQREVPSYFC